MESVKLITDALNTLLKVPFWLLAAIGITGFAVLYFPVVPGFPLEIVRTKFGSWVALIALAAVIFFAVRALFVIVHVIAKISGLMVVHQLEKPKASLTLTWNPQINTTWWAESRQSDGSFSTQICVDFFVRNQTTSHIYLRSTRLIAPKAKQADIINAIVIMSEHANSNMRSTNYFVGANGNRSARLLIIVRGRLGKPGQFLNSTLGVTDQNGFEYRIKVRLWPTSGANVLAGA